MTPEEIRRHFGAQASQTETLEFLSGAFIPEVIVRLNATSIRRRMAIYGGDRVPENERNLTDVRNRMSLLIEYKLAWLGNDILKEHGVEDVFWTNVVANRFPDLELRMEDGRRGIRVEVKCLQSIAEEKSANFDTLKKDLNPNTDYIVVFLWEWFCEVGLVNCDRAPMVLRGFVFHASSLAALRDYNWLNNPPSGLGNGYQGFDLRYAVNCRDGVYNEEEGNYGKLLRIWSEALVYEPGVSPLIGQTIGAYRDFEDYTVWSGFECLAARVLSLCGPCAVMPIRVEGRGTVGFHNGEIGVIFKRRLSRVREQHSAAQSAGIRRVIVMTDKYQWTDSNVTQNSLERRTQGRKPKHLLVHLAENLVVSGRE